MKPNLIAVVATILPLCIGCSHERTSQQKAVQEASRRQHQRFIAQRDAIDLLVQEQMKEHAFPGSKQEFAAKSWRTIFDSLVGKEIAAYSQLEELGDTVDESYVTQHMLQKENAHRWMADQSNGSGFLAFATDIWDFRHEGGVQFPDTLIIAVQDGLIVGYRTFAECPY